MTGDWLKMSAGALGRGIGAGQIDPVELAAAFLDAIAAHDHADRIYARLTRTRALAEAEAARTRAKTGHRLGPLDGVPISWKDLFDSAGVATEAGSALLAGRVPDRDAEVLANATAAGLVCLGKTQMTELAFSGLGVNPVTATPPNIHDTGAAPGGSSSGAAASVAFGLAAAGIGSDTGGSVRVPAVWNDLVGLKTGAGRLPLTGVVPLCARFDTVGPLTRNVEDAALLLAALEGEKPADLRGATLKGTRLMVLETAAFDDIRDAPAAGFEHAVDRLAQAGATIVRGEIPEVAEAMALSGVLFATEAYGTWGATIEAAPDKMYPEILKRFRGGRDFSGADYVAAWQTLDRLRAAYAAATAGFDAVLVPTCPILPPSVDRLLADPEFFVAENLMTLRNTRIGNLMGLAVLTLPAGVPSTGVSLMGPPMSEERLLRLGTAAEAALA
ncbi:amidase [Rhodovulum marinum]|uniref:Aspartyl-tRNA(Asn)/glutamyl-tRNA(Gln) amidotransferase subunit A n=1 Tax=Rhodovulum marinum TaxID=320662 RepID=A0A4R2PVN2_9RHOB|nr:amidase family protein [Rhodovulum marinum]TCP40163.1 aspartyl-tRNA(Asn)/glutamyl-tRNA(Gln) amidotransferase subunit A [Rhodovulum marinum]